MQLFTIKYLCVCKYVLKWRVSVCINSNIDHQGAHLIGYILQCVCVCVCVCVCEFHSLSLERFQTESEEWLWYEVPSPMTVNDTQTLWYMFIYMTPDTGE